MKLRVLGLATAVVVALLASTTWATVVIETVTVGDAGNNPDTRYDASGYGGVAYEYRIGKYEVTNAQWRDFLTANGRPGGGALGVRAGPGGRRKAAGSVGVGRVAAIENGFAGGARRRRLLPRSRPR